MEPSAKKTKLDNIDGLEDQKVNLSDVEPLEEKKVISIVEDEAVSCKELPTISSETSSGNGEISKEISGDSEVKQNLDQIKSHPDSSEEKYGLKCFINSGLRLSGMIKQRHTDFIVRECDTEGNLVELTNLAHIDDAYMTSVQPTECPITDENVLQKIKEFVDRGDKTESLVLDADDDKDHRKLVHKYIKDTFKNIETDTVEVGEGISRAIKLTFKSNNNNRTQRKPDWHKNIPKFCHFVLYKEGRTTMECINTIARMIHSKPACFTYAGTKDRRAATVQRVCGKNVHSKQLSGLNAKLQNMAVGNFVYKNDSLKLGDLSGNKFTIIIRDIIEPDEKIKAAMTSLSEKGFINYFGLQRFGSGDVPTHKIGLALLQSKFEEAVNMILHLTDNQRFEGQAKKVWHTTKNAFEALKLIKNRGSIEGKMLEHLSKQPRGRNYNYFNAFQGLPRNNRMLYLHSYQSFIWNEVVSRRLNELGHKPCVGDFVMSDTKDEQGHSLPLILTEANVDQFTIYDVVLPLPGYDVQYPTNKIGQYYMQMLNRDGVELGQRHKIKELSLSGTYRHIVVKPKDLTWSIETYDDYKISLVQTDIEKVKPSAKSASQDPVKQESLSKFKGVCLEMTLSTSCYATCALREVLAADSSYHSQKALSDNFHDRFDGE